MAVISIKNFGERNELSAENQTIEVEPHCIKQCNILQT